MDKIRPISSRYFGWKRAIFAQKLSQSQGNIDAARHFFEQNLRIDTELRFWDGMAEGWRNQGNLCRQQGKYEQASQCYEDCVLICLEHGLDKYEAFYASGLLALCCSNYALASLRFRPQLGLAKSPDKEGNAGALLEQIPLWFTTLSHRTARSGCKCARVLRQARPRA